jgi:hexosaminidase
MCKETVIHWGGSRRLFITFALIFATLIGGCSTRRKNVRRSIATPPSSAEISIIPQPTSVTPNEGYFSFDRDTKIIAVDQYTVRAAKALNEILSEKYDFKLDVTDDSTTENSILLSTDQSYVPEGYSLRIAPDSIEIKGSERGMFYGIQSLVQLLPPDFNGEAGIPAADILDAPRFSYRGMHLDVSRHFMPVKFVEKFISLISRYKYNYFHWHLTDDQGWRIEIKKYPRLTQIGSTRRESVDGNSYKRHVYVGDGKPVEGYYTQEQIREVVEYAKARYVTIIPEIDIPGHSSSALASYPKYGCKENYPYKVQTTWGAFPDIYCPTEETFRFIQDVLTEVVDLFPDSPYIHLGGDEVMTDSWRSSKFVQHLKRTNGLSTDNDVQSWFVNRVEKFLNSRDKKAIVWDDMLDVGLRGDAAVMCWRRFGEAYKSAVNAARTKHEVIMTPDEFTYFNHPQADPSLEPLGLGGPTPLSKVYSFEPVPAGLKDEDAKYVIGAEGCLWTEFMKTSNDVEYMMLPRSIALAEVLWSKPENKSFSGFSKRLHKEYPSLDREVVNYWGRRPNNIGDRKNDQVSKPMTDVASRDNMPAQQIEDTKNSGIVRLVALIVIPILSACLYMGCAYSYYKFRGRSPVSLRGKKLATSVPARPLIKQRPSKPD